MPKVTPKDEQGIRERAYFIWEHEGRPHDRAEFHWVQAAQDEQRSRDDDLMPDEERILAGRPDVNYPALLTRDVPGG
jgi:hypothetical protein